MKLITERQQIRDVAKEWEAIYKYYPETSEFTETTEKLKKLNVETATAMDVEAIIGNNSWCCPSTCDECGLDYDVVVKVGENPDYEGTTINLCEGCIKKALALISKGD